jgi:hypothetical protein
MQRINCQIDGHAPHKGQPNRACEPSRAPLVKYPG